MAWCDGHCNDPKCATCRACKEHRECDPVDNRDAAIEGCASWCSTSFSSEHCGKCSCKACDFCLELYPREDENPEVEDGDAPPSAPAAPIQMTDELRCYAFRYADLLAGFCNGDIEQCNAGKLNDHYEKWGEIENREFHCKSQDAQCYALRNPELVTVFCKGNVKNCDWLELKQHYSTTGAAAKEMPFGCRAKDSECYVQRYPDLLQGFCGGSVQGCDWFRVVEHWSRVGLTEARVFSCGDAPRPASDPSPSPPPPPPPSPRLSPPPPTVTKYTDFDESPTDVKASVQVVAPTMLTAAATDEQDTEIDVEVEPRTAAAPSLPLPRPTASTSQSYLPSLRPPGASKDDAEAPGAATGLSRLGSVSMLLAGALVFLFAVARSRIGGRMPVDGSTELADDMDDFDDDSHLGDYSEDDEEPPPSRKKASKKSKSKDRRHGGF